MSPEIRRAALRAAAKTALIAALGCGGSDPKPVPPQNVTGSSAPIEVVDEDPAVAKAKQEAEAVIAKLATLEKTLAELEPKVSGAVDEVMAAQNDADRAAAKTKLEQLRRDKAVMEASIADAKETARRATHFAIAIPCVKQLDKLALADRASLPATDPLSGRHDIYGKVFADVAKRNAADTQRCCSEEMIAYGSSAKHRWECCSALPALPADAEQSACTPWGPPCPPAMA